MDTTSIILSFDIGIKNLAYCELDKATGRIHRWDVINLLQEDERCKNVKLDEMCMRILDAMNDQFQDAKYAYVLLENQPVMKNPIMKSVQIIIYTYFQMQKMLFGEVNEVKLVSARNKLNKLTGVQLEADEEAVFSSMPEGYKKNKKMAVAYVRRLLDKHVPNGNDERIKTLFNKSKKQDDLADAFLQAWTFAQETRAV